MMQITIEKVQITKMILKKMLKIIEIHCFFQEQNQ